MDHDHVWIGTRKVAPQSVLIEFGSMGMQVAKVSRRPKRRPAKHAKPVPFFLWRSDLTALRPCRTASRLKLAFPLS